MFTLDSVRLSRLLAGKHLFPRGFHPYAMLLLQRLWPPLFLLLPGFWRAGVLMSALAQCAVYC